MRLCAGKNAFSLRLLPILTKKFLWSIYLLLEHLFALFSARRLRELIENIVYLFKGVHKYEMEKRGIFEEFINQKHQLLRCSIN